MCPIRQHTKSLQSLEQSTLLDTWHLFFIMNLKVTSCRSACHPVLVCICMNFITITLSGNSNCLTFLLIWCCTFPNKQDIKRSKAWYFKAVYIEVINACLFVSLYLSVCLSVRASVRPSVCLSFIIFSYLFSIHLCLTKYNIHNTICYNYIEQQFNQTYSNWYLLVLYVSVIQR